MVTELLKGMLIGFLGGLFSAVAMFLWLVVFAVAVPGSRLGSTWVLAPITGGICSAVFGVLLGGGARAIAGLVGFRVEGLRRGTLFGMILMGTIGALFVVFTFVENPERAAVNLPMTFSLPLTGCTLGGAASGALLGKLSRTR